MTGTKGFLLILAAALTLTYAGMRRNEAVYDDPIYLQENPGMRSLSNIPRLFSRGYVEVSRDPKAYRPVPVALRIAAYALVEGSPAAHRAVNLLVHFLNACLLYWICRRYFFTGSAAAFWAGLIFGLHPVVSECILCATFLYSPLALLFCLGALSAYLEARGSTGPRRPAWAAASWACFVLGLLCKETAALFPAAILAYEALSTAHPWRSWRNPVLWSYAPPLLAYQYLRFSLFGEYARAPYIGGTFAANFLTSLKTLPIYAGLLLRPHPLSVSYRVVAAKSWAEPAVLAALALSAVLAAAAVALWRKGERRLLFWMFMLLWPMIPVMNWIPFFDETMLVNERHLYFTLAAFAAAGGLALARLKKAGAALGAALLLACAWTTARRVPDWRDEVSLHRQAVEADPSNYRALNDLGWAYHKRGDLDLAVDTYRRALAIFPGIVTCVRLAAAYEAQGRLPEAARLLDAVLAVADGLSVRHYGIREQAQRVSLKLAQRRP